MELLAFGEVCLLLAKLLDLSKLGLEAVVFLVVCGFALDVLLFESRLDALCVLLFHLLCLQLFL